MNRMIRNMNAREQSEHVYQKISCTNRNGRRKNVPIVSTSRLGHSLQLGRLALNGSSFGRWKGIDAVECGTIGISRAESFAYMFSDDI